MQTRGLTERVEAAILEQVFSDDELENRVRSLLGWKIRFNTVHVADQSGSLTLSGGAFPPWTAILLSKPLGD